MPMSARRLIPALCLALAAWVWMRPACAAEPAPKPLTAAGVENLFQVTAQVYSGSQPEGDAGFAALRQLGIRTLLSVDGTVPDIDRAAQFGLRYIHLPHGYDGIPRATALRLARAATTAEGPLYVHCHHGRHRGPAAVGIICQATEGWTTNQAVAWLKQAGTAADYAGLYRDNATFRRPAPAELAALPNRFPSRAEVPGLVEAMVQLDRRWDRLKVLRQAGWKVPSDQPDLRPAHEALLLRESYAELRRHPETAPRGEEFLARLRQAEEHANQLHELLQESAGPVTDSDRPRLDRLLAAAAEDCTACHRQFRN